jgi:phospholipid-binding lipoprotein MlaA
VINTRANLLGASQVLDDIALDKYTFLRDAYLQRRRSLVYDGNAPDADPASDSSDPGPTPAAAPGASAPAKAASSAAEAASSPTPGASAPR